MILLSWLRQMSIGTKPQTYMRSYKTPSVAYFSRDTIIKASLHLFMFVYGELKKTIYISLEVMEFTPPAPPPNKAYLSLYKLVPVVIRKRSEEENERGRFLTSRQAHQETLQFECLDLWSFGVLSCSSKNSRLDWSSESLQVWFLVSLLCGEFWNT